MHFFTKFRAAAAGMGLANACLYAVSRLTEAVFGTRVRVIKYYFMAQPIAAAGAASIRGSFTFSWAGPGAAILEQAPRPAAVLADRFAQGARCLAAASSEGELAGFLWFVIGPYREDEVRASFVPRPEGASAWDFDVAVMPRYRMGRLFGLLWQNASKELAARGVRQTISRISAFNAASIASHRRLGARRVGEALFVCVGPLQFMKASMRPKWHLSWRESQRPTLSIEA